ncbi:hypothetical protein Cflav_PD4644 [Pedosphaera parvula Ellin514]|uniref:Uncharacterized protein n=1 Tax=Pedosphaera parvula (strain Ellin514) TaxID=320771 RepID=B9XE90_PEDPL|nr:hypothetical protein Cflav_PD4644 [Pedosphaera parvula Ellin514]
MAVCFDSHSPRHNPGLILFGGITLLEIKTQIYSSEKAQLETDSGYKQELAGLK